MSDFRFKVCGSASPFIAELYRASDNHLVSKKLVEYEGENTPDVCNHTCVIFDGLIEEESYYVKIIDNLGYQTNTTSCETPINPEPTPIELNVNMLGTICCSSNNDNNITTLTAPKNIEITPTLSISQSIRLELEIGTDYSENNMGSASVTVYCKPSGSSTYSIVASENDRNVNCVFTVDMNAGDQICYNMNATSDKLTDCCVYPPESPSGTSSLSLCSVTPLAGFGTCCNITTGPNTDINVCSCTPIPVTTTTTSQPEVQVFFDNPQTNTTVDPITNECIVTIGAKLGTNPSLDTNQCFRVCLGMYNDYSITGTLNENMCARSTVYENNTTLKELTLINTVSCNNNCDNLYYDVCSENINDLCFCARVCDNTENSIVPHTIMSSIFICGISGMINGNYTYDDLSTCKSISVATTYGSLCCI